MTARTSNNEIYLDYNSTAPVHPEVLDAVMPVFSETYGNPSTLHQIGQRARTAVEQARRQTAALLSCEPNEIVFTSGGTESNNLALLGACYANGVGNKKHIITTTIEHPSIHQTCRWLEKHGYRITFVSVDHRGVVDVDQLAAALDSETVLVSVLHANNETGTIQPIRQIAEFTGKHGVLFHVDGVQAAGKIPVDVRSLGCDLYSISAHKFGGLKGAGALYIRQGVDIERICHGGNQEAGRRAGTLNVPGIVALGKAAEVALRDLETNRTAWRACRSIFDDLPGKLPLTRLNGHRSERLPNTTNLCFLYADGTSTVLALSVIGICAGTGSACTSDRQEPSAVLKAMGLSDFAAFCSIRISFGPSLSADQAEYACSKIAQTVERIRTIIAPEDIGVCDESCPCFFEPRQTT